MEKKFIVLSLIMMLGLLLSACQPTPTATPPASDNYEYGQNARVEGLEVISLENGQANVRVSGYLPDGCTELHEISVERDGMVFELILITRKPSDDIVCKEALVSFEEIVNLNVENLEPPYKITIQNQDTTFSLEAYDDQKQGEGDFIYGNEATVDSLQVTILESFPVQVSVTLEGTLPDGCTEIHEILSSRDGKTFNIEIVTRRPSGDVACTMALVPFEESISLDVVGLEAGTYEVVARDQEASFTLDVDNLLQEPGGEGKYLYGSEARVRSMTVDVIASDPTEVRVTLDGYLPDGCPKIHEITYERQDDVFTIEIVTRRPSGDVFCTMAIVPFTETVSLDVAELPAGDYTVRCGGLEESFSLDL